MAGPGPLPDSGRTLYRASCFRQRVVADRQAESQMALYRAGDRAMIEWRRLYAKPAGSLPGGVVTQYGVGAITVFVLLFLTYWIWFGGGEPAELPEATGTEPAAPRSFTDRMAAQVEAEALLGRGRAGTRPSRYAHPGSFLEPSAQHHNPGRAPAPRPVHFRRAGSPAQPRRLK